MIIPESNADLDRAELRLFDPSNEADNKAMEAIVERRNPFVVDTYDEQVEELGELKHRSKLPTPRPFWVYLPWKNSLVKIMDAESYRTLRSSRNLYLMTEEEQDAFEAAHVAIAGLNVGNPAAICLALQGGARRMRLTDFDTLSLSNLNRFRAGIAELGRNKAVLTAQQIYEINPYVELDIDAEGLKPHTQADYLKDVDVLVEEMDNLHLKISIREEAKRRGIPVVMVTGNGANVIIDVERFDQDPDLPLLSGHLKPEVIEKIGQVTAETPPQERLMLARDFMGKEFLTDRLNHSFTKVGTELAGIPQLAESSFLRGAAVCYAVRMIVTGGDLPSGRYNLNLEELTK